MVRRVCIWALPHAAPIPLTLCPAFSPRSAAPLRFRLVHPDCGDGTPSPENLHKFMRATLRSVSDHADAWPFLEPVDPVEVPDYYEIVKEPMSLQTIWQRIDAGDYYITLEVRAQPAPADVWRHPHFPLL